ncbi:MAG: TetR/AcrR family transcriptional regulator [Acidimicrobiales bacterium]
MYEKGHVDATTENLLAAGVDLILERGLRPALPRFALRDVAERAGVSPGSLYQRWPNTEAFLKALAIHLMEEQISSNRPDKYLLPLLEQGLRGNELVRAWARLDLKAITGSPKWHAKLALWPLLNDPEVAEAVRGHYRRADAADVGPFRLMIAWQGGRLRENLSEENITLLRTAMREGLAVRSIIDPDIVRDDIRTDDLTETDSDWSLLALSLAAISASFIEKATDD